MEVLRSNVATIFAISPMGKNSLENRRCIVPNLCPYLGSVMEKYDPTFSKLTYRLDLGCVHPAPVVFQTSEHSEDISVSFGRCGMHEQGEHKLIHT